MADSIKSLLITQVIAQGVIQLMLYFPFKSIISTILGRFGFNTFYVTDINTVRRIQKRMTDKCIIISDERGYGPVWGKWFWLNIYETSVVIISKKEKYEELIEEFPDNKIKEDKHQVTIYDRTGPYTYNWYDKRKVYIHNVTEWPNQEEIMNTIITQYKEKKHAVALLWGPPGCGKSMTSLLLSVKLKGNFCNVLKPWMPNSTLASLYTASTPSEESPLIIAMDEFDGPLLKIHNGEIPINEKLPTLITDKTGWNLFFDEIQRGMYPYVIIILTTNKSPDFINELDSSYIRKGRVDYIEEMKMNI